MKAMDQEAMKVQYQTFAAGMKTLMLSTIDEHGTPFISYAPFVKHNGNFYIYISKIANHYRYLEEQPGVDAMLIEDESKTANLFARKRARFVCTARNIGNTGHDEIFAQFEQRFGKSMMDMLRGLDFSLFELEPSEGRYVAGFGQAYDIDLAADKFVHVNRDGHSQSAK
ncbi:heme iron utilization protein [Brevibacillus parabrevis]|uniref:HugZ family pyridoxamine 5'-phosphate oxidase n=1 Tax=Brevibacillus parabrevis TaxID=54914 RepID=UPI0007ABE050|nr:pyridoxamine 5'-phosphate oxidase family protein [Brevibacillus parabrevis]KZE51644.1 heme iron utilization protein [Brevibacillus parabrevis]